MSANGRAPYLEAAEGGRLLLSHELTFATVADVLAESQQAFSDHASITIDMSAVTEADSAGLALLIEWLSWARLTSRQVRFENVPEQLLQIADISEVAELIGTD